MIRNRNGKFQRFDVIHSLVGGGISGFDEMDCIFYDDQTPPTTEEIDAEIVKLETEYKAQLYARNRVAEYPSQGDQNDMMYKDTKNSTTTHADAVEAVKTKWPKDNSGPIE